MFSGSFWNGLIRLLSPYIYIFFDHGLIYTELARWCSGKESTCQARDASVILWRRKQATHSGILAWEIPWTEEPGGLYSPWDHKRVIA